MPPKRTSSAKRGTNVNNNIGLKDRNEPIADTSMGQVEVGFESTSTSASVTNITPTTTPTTASTTVTSSHEGLRNRAPIAPSSSSFPETVPIKTNTATINNSSKSSNGVGLGLASPASPTSIANAALELGPALGGVGRELGEPKRLYTFDELPVHLRDNPFILTHYRAYLTSQECVHSVFEIHNETGNIWTHLLGFFFFLALGLWVLIDVIPRGAGVGHYVIFIVLTLGCMGCMACSTTFHTMAAHMDLERFKKFHAMDYLGITLLIVASFVPCCYYTFVCQPSLQWGYLAMICCVGSSGIITPLLPCFEEEYFFWPRLGIYVSIVCSGLVPTVHTCFATPLNSTTSGIYIGVLLMFLLYGTGVIVYASNFPERFAPGRFDIWLMSHQVWHIFVLAAAIVHYFTCVALYQNWSVMQGRC